MAKINEGFYISQQEYFERGLEATIYSYSESGWATANTGKPVSEAELPEAPGAMWPLRLLQR